MKRFLKCDSTHRILSLLMVIAMLMSMLPVTSYAVTPGIVTTNIDELVFEVGEWTQFEISTTANDDLGTKVTGTATFSDPSAIEAVQYREITDGTWRDLEGDFGPAGGFPLMDAKSEFRVKFLEAGIYTVDISITGVEDKSFVRKTSATVTVTGRSTLTSDIDKQNFVVNEPTTFSFTTMANEDTGALVLGCFDFSDDQAVDKLEYRESKDGNWYAFTGDFGPTGGFPLTDHAISQFRVTFKKTGTYSLYAYMKDVKTGNTLCFTTATITVKDRSGISFAKESIEIKYSDVNVINDTLVDDVEGAEYTYASDNETVVKVNEYGILTPVSLGKATITVTRKENAGYLEATASYKVTVMPGIQEELVWNKTIPASIPWNDPEGYSNTVSGDSVMYTSDNTDVAEVDPVTGELKLKKPGTVVITATKSGAPLYVDQIAHYSLLVTKAKQEALKFPEQNPNAIYFGDVYEENVAFGGSVDGTIVYSSSDHGVATVDGSGKVTAVGQGSVTITATLAGNDYYEPVSATYDITVYRADQKTELKFSKGTENQMIKFGWTEYANVASGGDTAPITYSSSDPTIASVDPVTGLVTTHKTGKVTITALAPETQQYKKHEISYELEVGSGEQKVVFKKGNINIDAITYGDAYQNQAFAKTDVTYASSDSSVAEVDDQGNLIIYKAGTVKITATAASSEQYNEASDFYSITINKAQQIISFEKGEEIDGRIVANVKFNDNENKFVNIASSNATRNDQGDNKDIEINYAIAVGKNFVVDGIIDNGGFEIKGAGTVTVAVSFSGNDRYESNMAFYTLIIQKSEQNIAFDKATYEMINGDQSFTAPKVTTVGAGTGTITYSIKEDSSGIIRQINSATGEMEFTNKLGFAVILATKAADDNYEAATAEYTLIVKPWDTGDVYHILTDNKVNGLHTGNVSIIAMDGYLLSYDQSGNADSWKSSLEDAVTEDGTHTVQFYAKHVATGRITGQQSAVITKDTMPPEAEIIQKELEGWDKFLSVITFGMWEAEKATFTIASEDANGISKVEYILVKVEDTPQIMDTDALDKITDWQPYNGSVDAVENAIFVVYAKVTDNAGHHTYAATNGIIADRIPVPEEGIRIDAITENHKGFYNCDVELSVQIKDAKPSSGIQTVTYKVYNGEVLTQEGVLFQFDKENPTYEELVSSWNCADDDQKIVVDSRENNSDNVKVEVTVTDNAGNVSSKEIPLKICVSEPTVQISFIDDLEPVETFENISYYDTQRTAKIVVTGRRSVFLASDAPALLITETKGNTGEGKTYETTNWVTEGNSENPDAAIHTCQVTFKGSANYQFAVAYVDVLGHSAEHSVDDFVVDGDAPTAEVIIDKDNTWTTLLSTLTFGLWKNTEVTVKASAVDATSPIRSIEYFKSNAVQTLTEAELEDVAWVPFEEFTVSEDERFAVYLKITDRAGHIEYVSSDGYILDTTGAQITLTPEVTDRTHHEIPLYNDDVEVSIHVVERVSEISSGIKEVKYWVTSDGKVTQPEAMLYSFGYQMEDYVESGEDVPSYEELCQEFSQKVTIDSKLNNSCNVVLYVGVTDNAGNYCQQSVTVDIDITAPTIKLCYDNNDPHKVVENRGYFPSDRIATVVITEREGHFVPGKAIEGIKIRAVDAKGNVAEVNSKKLRVDEDENLIDLTELFGRLEWKTEADALGDQTTHTLELPYIHDANYTFSMSYEDLAGNAAEGIDSAEEKTPYEFTVDKTKPTATIAAGAYSWEKLLELLSFGLYSNTNVRISVTEKDDVTSPIEAIQYHKTADTAAKTHRDLLNIGDWTDITKDPQLTISQEERVTVYLKVTDYAGNDLYINADGYILDKTGAEITLTPDATDRNHNNISLYNKDVNVKIDVVEEKSETYSGIKEVKYWVTCDGNITQEKVLYSFTYAMSDYVVEGENVPSYDELLHDFSETVIIEAQKNNSCNVVLYVGVTDNAGNYTEESMALDIDATPPAISVAYDNNELHKVVGNKGYYSQARTATIVITEKACHFDSAKATAGIKIKAVDAKGDVIKVYGETLEVDGDGNILDLDQLFGALVWKSSEENNTHTLTLVYGRQKNSAYGEDADYTFAISYEDNAGTANTPVTTDGKTPYQFVVDTGLAEITLTPEATNRYHEDIPLYNNDVDVQVDVVEKRDESYSGISKAQYWVTCDDRITQEGTLYTANPNAAELTHDFSTMVTINSKLNNSCNVVLHVTVEDNSGNVVEKKLQVDVDITAPTIDVSYDNNAPYKVVGNRGYFPANRTATVVITERADHFEADKATAGIKIKAVDADGNPIVVGDIQLAVDAQGYLVDITQLFGELKWDSKEGSTLDQATHTLVLPYIHDANYDFGMNYADKAENSDVGIHADEEQVAPYEFTIDKIKPTATVSAQEYNWNKLLEVLSFGLYSNTEVQVVVTEKDDVTSGIESIHYYKTSDVTTKTHDELDAIVDWTDITADPRITIADEERFAVYLKITDNVGNYLYINSDGYIVDKTSAGITLTPAATDLSHNNIPLYNGDVDVQINVVEEKGETYSGIKEVKYWVTCDDEITQEEVLYSFDYEMSDYVAEGEHVPSYAELLHDFTETVTIASKLNNSCYVVLHVGVTDNAGNYSEQSVEVDIDITAPTIEVSYDNNKPYKEGYFPANRTATIKLTERAGHFEADKATAGIKIQAVDLDGNTILVGDTKLLIDAQGYLVDITQLFGGLKWDTAEGETPDLTTHTLELPYTHDANYTFGMDYADLAMNEAADVYADEAQVAPFAFTIDKVEPTATVAVQEYNWSKLLEVLSFGLYSNTEVEVKVTEKDDVTSGIESIYCYKTNDITIKTHDELDAIVDWTDITANPSLLITEEEVFTVYLRITDNAGNYLYINSDGYIVDKTLAGITLTPDATDRSHNNIPLYNGDVNVKIDVVEEKGETYSGIKEVKYWVTCDREISQPEVVLYSFDYQMEDYVAEGEHVPFYAELRHDFSETVTIQSELNNSCNVVLHVMVTDNAGNVATQTVEVDIDITAPTIDLTYDNNAPYKVVEDKGYFPADRIATIVITERAGHFESDKATAGIKIKAVDAEGKPIFVNDTQLAVDNEGYLVDITRLFGELKWDTMAGSIPDLAIHTLVLPYIHDANYTFAMSYTDLAANSNQNVNCHDSVTPDTFAVDKTAPTGKVTVGELGSWDKLIDVLTFGLWSQDAVDVTATTGDLTTRIESVSYYKTDDVTAKTRKELDAVTFWSDFNGITVPADEKFTVYLRIIDDAGNVTYISTNGVIVDDTVPTIEYVKPEITITPEPANGIYNSDVVVAVSVVDPEIGDTNAYAGLKEIRYEVYSLGVKTQNGVLYSFSTADPAYGQLQQTWSKADAIVVDKDLNNSNDVKIVVYAVDNAGNDNQASCEIKIDKTAPKISVTYDNNNGDTSFADRTYFKANRTAKIVITERNFDPAKVTLTITNSDGYIPQMSEWVTVKGTENGDNTTHTAYVAFDKDGDYTFDIACVDTAENTNPAIDYASSLAPKSFTIDKTAPVVSITYDNNEAENGNYYKAARTATITIKEHNFETGRIKVTLSATDDGKRSALPAVSKWSSKGDVHTATITYEADSCYVFDFDYNDKAGNGITDIAQQIFYVDKTNPVLTIEKIVDQSANNNAGDIGFVMTATDTNFDVFTPVLTAVVKNGDAFETKELEIGEMTDIKNGKVLTVTNIETDGIYRITCTIVDMAGNAYSEVTLEKADGTKYVESRAGKDTLVTFSVNRDGSTFEIDQNTIDLTEQYYVQNVANNIVIVEINADPLIEYAVTLNGKEIKKDQDYTVALEGGKGAWMKYTYTVSKDLFAEEGEYKLVVSSKDKAENDAFSDIKDATVAFVVDRTAPVVTVSGISNDGRYQTDKQVVTLIPTDDGGALKTLIVNLVDESGNVIKELINLSDEALVAQLEENSGKITFEIAEGLYQNVQIVCTDCAVDETGDANTYEVTIKNVSVSSNAIMIFWANKHMRWGTIAGVSIAAAAMVIFIILKKRKHKEGGVQ